MNKLIILIIAALLAFGGTALTGERKTDRGVVELQGVDVKHSVVRIRGYEGVSPLNLFIAPGTVVVWINQYQGNVKISFPGKKVTLACKSPVNFLINDQGIFVSQSVRYGAVASLCFVERGTFDYVIERSPASASAQSEGFRFEGKIIVK